MVACQSVVLRKVGGGRSGEVRAGRFLSNAKVSLERLLDGWSLTTASAVAGRDVLAIQDSSKLCFTTAAQRGRLGKIGKGGGHGLVLHAMLAVDAASGQGLGLVAGAIWSRDAHPKPDPPLRPLAERESMRWLSTAEAAKRVLASARRVTVVADRESDLFAEWVRLPEPTFHLLTRAAQNRLLAEGGKLFDAAAGWPAGQPRVITVPHGAKAVRQQRDAVVTARFGSVVLRRPKNERDTTLPPSVTVRLVEVREEAPPAGAAPVIWRLLTTHAVDDEAAAWRIVDWYRQRWWIEQLFRTLKQQGLRLEDSQIETPEALIKLTAIAAKAAVLTLQLVQARDGALQVPASVVFDQTELATLAALGPTLEGNTAKQKNPHPPDTLAWAAWIIARLGGWNGYASQRPPGPITFLSGLRAFNSVVRGFSLRNVCMP